MTQTINPNVFRAYDIRGIYPQDINKDFAYNLGKAFIELTGSKTVVVGRDMRLGGDELFNGLTTGLENAGVKVIDLGLVPIDVVYFAVGHYKYDGGIMITASHNPKEYNGFKMVVKSDKGIDWIRGIDIKDKFASETSAWTGKAKETEKKDIWQDYLIHIFSFVDKNKIKPLKIVVDAGNGMAGKVIPLLEKELSVEIIKMNFELDGNFPSHPSNPLNQESHTGLQKRVVEEGADIGFIFDGDTDRIFLVDDKGNFLRGDTSLILLAKYFLDNKIGDTFIYNAVCSKAVSETIQKMGGRAFREKVGYTNLAERMKKEKGVLSGEVSGHYSFAKNFYADSGFIPFLMILQLISESKKPLEEMAQRFNPYFRADEQSIEVDDIPREMDKAKQEYKDYKQDELDGLTVDAWDTEGWWLNVRPSNTEPLLRITVEGRTENLMKEKLKEIIKVIGAN